MQIDFHHTATYAIARIAGFAHEDASIIAHCAQYVDDATNTGTIEFDNGAMYSHISSAHKHFDYRNFSDLAMQRVWLPFHFLPGNGGKVAGDNPNGSFIEKIICLPDSPVAQDMIASCIREREARYGLHRLGVTMHVYADTWAHQGFAGVNHRVNDIRALDDHDEHDGTFLGKVGDFFGDTFDRVTSSFVTGVLPLGHVTVLSYPDSPYLTWSYDNHHGDRVVRDNPKDYLVATQAMCRAMQRYIDPDAEAMGMSDALLEKFDWLFRNLVVDDSEERHQAWTQHLADDYFGFGPAAVSYIAKGPGSWKYQALKTTQEVDLDDDVFPFDASFMDSDWKHFHDALQVHRFKVLHEILPRYGICAG